MFRSRTFLCFAVIAVLIVATYFCWFGIWNGGQLSTSAEDWARFGEYIGGAFAVLAFLGVLVGLDVQRQQTTIEELQRMVRGVAADVDRVLDARADESNPQALRTLRDASVSANVRSVLAVSQSNPGLLMQAIFQDLVQKAVDPLTRELNRLDNVLTMFLREGGNDVIAEYYRRQYSNAVKAILALDIAEDLNASVRAWAELPAEGK